MGSEGNRQPWTGRPTGIKPAGTAAVDDRLAELLAELDTAVHQINSRHGANGPEKGPARPHPSSAPRRAASAAAEDWEQAIDNSIEDILKECRPNVHRTLPAEPQPPAPSSVNDASNPAGNGPAAADFPTTIEGWSPRLNLRPVAGDRGAHESAAAPARATSQETGTIPKFLPASGTPLQPDGNGRKPRLRVVSAAAEAPSQARQSGTAQAPAGMDAAAAVSRPEASAKAAEAKAPEARTTDTKAPEAKPPEAKTPEAKTTPVSPQRIPPIIDADRGPLRRSPAGGGGNDHPPARGGGGGGGGNQSGFHKRAEMPNFAESFRNGINAVRHNIAIVMAFTLVINILVLAIPIYLFQISSRVLTSRSLDTLVMLTIVVVGAVLLQGMLDAIRRFILMRTAVEMEVQLGAPVLAAAARSSLSGSSKDYQVLGDLNQLRSFITSGTLIAILDAPLAPIFVLAVFFVHPQLGYIVVVASLCLMVIAYINQHLTAHHFAESNSFLSRASLHLDSMSRNAQIINALAMIPEAVRIWGRDTASSLSAQVRAQDRNIVLATMSKTARLITQVTILGWGARLALNGELTGGMVIAASIISARALTPIEGAIEGWHSFTQFRQAFQRIRNLLQASPLNFQRLILPDPKGRLDVERILFVPPPNKKVILNGISFSLAPGESLAIIGNSGAGKTTLGKMLVGSILPTSGSVRLDLMDLRNWDQRQFGENIGYLPQDVQLFPGSIKANIGRMREDASDEAIYRAAVLADVHELIASFPQGYETLVAADGAPLSGGQKQRIALARAFFGDPKLVVLDEPNSNLDTPGESALAKAIIHARKSKITVVTITQRMALLNYVDKVLVLKNGGVAAFGQRDDILKAITKAGGSGDRPARLPEGE